MFKLAVICPEKLARGFELTGVDVFTSDSKEETEEFLFQTIEDKKAGLVILPQEHLEAFEERKRKELEKLEIPLIVPVPMIQGSDIQAEEYVSQMVRRAIGYQVKIGG